MSDVTSPATATSSPNLEALPLYQDATPEQRAALEADYARCLEQGVSPEEYTAALAEYTTAGSYLATLEDEPAEGEDPNTAPVPAPATSTLADANRTLLVFRRQCQSLADHNYALAGTAALFVGQFLGASPGKATRSTAVERLAAEWLLWDEDSMATPLPQAMKRLKDRVRLLLHTHAAATLLGDGTGVAKGNGTASGRGKGRKDGRLPWGTMRELNPLVWRDDSDTAETWHVLASVEEQARSLVAEIAQSGMARADVVKAVAALRLVDAQQEHAAAVREGNSGRIRAAELAVEQWGGKIERADAAKPTPAAGTETAASVKAPAPQQEPAAADEEPDADEPEEPASPPEQPGECRGENLLKAAKAGTAPDVADMALELVTGGDEPDTVFELLLKLLDGHKALCRASHRAIKAALLTLNRKPEQAADKDASPAPATQEPAATVKIPA